jgi:hypothetical protein
VIVYTGRNLTRDEEAELMRYSRSIIIKGARSPERLLDEVTLFLHKVENQLSAERQKMLRTARSRDKAFEGRKHPGGGRRHAQHLRADQRAGAKGVQVEIGAQRPRGLASWRKMPDGVDLVLMDIMMPEMDGLAHARSARTRAGRSCPSSPSRPRP